MKEIPLETPEAGRVVLSIHVGDRVEVGQVIGELQTDKATAELQAPEAFTLRAVRKTPDGFILTVEE